MRRQRLAILFVSLVTLASSAWCGQETITTTVAVPGRANLTAGDVLVTVGGKSASISSPAPLVSPTGAAKADDLSSEPPEKIVSPTIFVFDVMETRAVDERDMRKIVLHYMAAAAARKEAVGLVLLTENGLKMVHDYRTGSAVLAAALDAVNGKATAVPGADRVLAEETKRLLDFSKGADSNAVPQILRTYIEGPTVMMRDIAASLAGIPGRKAIVWLTNGVPFEILEDDHSVTSHFETNNGPSVAGMRVTSTKRYLNDDQISKLQPNWRAALDNLFESGTAVYPIELRGASGIPGGMVLTSTMDSLARMTGGRASYGSNDPTPFFASIAAENASSAQLTFTYDPGKGDWQKLTFTVAGSGKVVAPSGFFPPRQKNADELRKQALVIALRSPMSYIALPFRLTPGEQTANGAKKSVKFAVFLAPNSGVADPKAGEVSIDVAAVAINPSGTHVASMSAAAGGKLPPDALQQIAQTGVNISKEIELPPGDYTLRVIVRDNLSGRIGTVNAPLKVQ